MKAIKHITLGAIVTLSIFCAVLYSSCAKDQCGAVVCQYKGTCSGGVCTCPKGLEGVNCEIVYRNRLAGTFKGIPPDDPFSDTTNTLQFTADDDSTNYNTMEVVWTDTAGHGTTWSIELTKNTPAGSQFVITPFSSPFVSYKGFGSVSATSASLQVTTTYVAGGGSITQTFSNYVKQ